MVYYNDPGMDKNKWYPEWHIIQIQYRESNDSETRVLGYLGHTSATKSGKWHFKVKQEDTWARCKSHDKGINKLLKHHGLKGQQDRIIPIAWQWNSQWC